MHHINFDSINQYISWFTTIVLEHLPQVLIALIILIAGWIIAKIIKNSVRKILFKTKLDKAVSLFFNANTTHFSRYFCCAYRT